jgi:hypothetical protein
MIKKLKSTKQAIRPDNSRKIGVHYLLKREESDLIRKALKKANLVEDKKISLSYFLRTAAIDNAKRILSLQTTKQILLSRGHVQ